MILKCMASLLNSKVLSKAFRKKNIISVHELGSITASTQLWCYSVLSTITKRLSSVYLPWRFTCLKRALKQKLQ